MFPRLNVNMNRNIIDQNWQVFVRMFFFQILVRHIGLNLTTKRTGF